MIIKPLSPVSKLAVFFSISNDNDDDASWMRIKWILYRDRARDKVYMCLQVLIVVITVASIIH